MALIKQSSTEFPLLFLLVDSTDHVTAKTGLTPTVTLSKAGGSFASPSGSVSEVGNGWYKVAANATDTGTLGPLVLHATGTGADPVDVMFEVVKFDPQDAAIGISDIASIKAKTDNIPASPAATSDIPTAADVADAVWDEALSGHTTAGTLGKAVSDTSTAATAIKAKTDNLPASPAATGDIPTAADITDAVWDEATSGHSTAGTTGKALTTAAAISVPTAATIADAVWDEAQSGHTTTGTFGDYLDSAVSGVSTGGLTADDIADAVLDEALSGHVTAGTLGKAVGDILDDTGTSGVKVDDSTPIDANVQAINDVTLTGNGATTPWGPE